MQITARPNWSNMHGEGCPWVSGGQNKSSSVPFIVFAHLGQLCQFQGWKKNLGGHGAGFAYVISDWTDFERHM